MSDSISSKVTENMTIFEKLFDFKYFLLLLSMILSFDIFLSLVFHNSIISINTNIFLEMKYISYL